MEKIYFSLRGPHPDNSKRSRGGAPPGPTEGDFWPGFPRLGIARVVELPSALIESGETNFLLIPGRIPFAGRGVGEAARIGIFLPPGPRRTRPTQTVFHLIRQLPNHLPASSPFPRIWNKALFLLDHGSVRRPSGRGKRRDSAWGDLRK